MSKRNKIISLKEELEDYYNWLTRFRIVSPLINTFLEELKEKIGKDAEWVVKFLQASDSERKHLLRNLWVKNSETPKEAKEALERKVQRESNVNIEDKFKDWW